jgi:hypothetical protein
MCTLTTCLYREVNFLISFGEWGRGSGKYGPSYHVSYAVCIGLLAGGLLTILVLCVLVSFPKFNSLIRQTNYGVERHRYYIVTIGARSGVLSSYVQSQELEVGLDLKAARERAEKENRIVDHV